MAEPKKRLTSTRSGNRRSNLKLKKVILSKCAKCKSDVLPHRVCPTCGYYRGEDILKLEEKLKAKQDRRKALQEAEQAAEAEAKEAAKKEKQSAKKVKKPKEE